jgi:hypothetical protein
LTTFNMSAIMDAIALSLSTATVTTTANTFAYPVASFTPPCSIVGYPKPGQINLDITAKRGGIEATFPVWIVVGKTVDISARNKLSALLDGGAATAKTAIESDPTLGGVVASNMVLGPDVEVISDTLGTEYLAAKFEVQIIK